MKTAPNADAKFQEAMRHHQSGDFARAAALYRKVLARSPAHADALHLLGLIEAEAGKLAAAADLMGRSLRIRAENPAAWNNYGSALLGLGRAVEALEACGRAIALKPDYAIAHLNRGNALRDLGRPEGALESYDRALILEPGSADALCNRGNALRDLRRLHEAVESYNRALAVNPNLVEALCGRGAAKKDLRQFDEALRDYESALALSLDYPTALNNCGDALIELGRYKDAAEVYDRLLDVAPEYDYMAGYAVLAKLRSCNWVDYTQYTQHLIDGVRRGQRAADPFSFLAMSASSRDQLICARGYAAARFPSPADPLWTGDRYGHDRIRVAYLSADFHDHAVAYLTARLFERHDRRRFEVTAVSYGPDRPGAMRTRLRSAFDRFLDVAEYSDIEVSRLLRSLEIDIAVDLMGWTKSARPGILACRPAPVQVSYLGFTGTLGAEFIDYLLADRHVIPPGDAAHYSEKVVYLPEVYMVNDSERVIAPNVSTRADAGLPENGFVFCCFNNSYKIAPSVFDVWMRLLRDIRGSVLWLRNENADARCNLQSEAEHRGVSGERLIFAPPVPQQSEHLARHALADLFLDTLPFNAHTTASDALWAGLPLLTCTGSTFAGRVATSLLHAIGLPELITKDLPAYEARARQLAASPGELARLRERLAKNRRIHPLFDTARFTRHLESAYCTMWERSEHSEAAVGFDVQAIGVE